MKFISLLLIAPFLVIIWVLNIFNEFVFLLINSFRLFFRKKPTQDQQVQKEASIVILNWNGQMLLEECLPSVIAEVKRNGGNHEIIVIDNGSQDGSVEYLKSNFSEVKVVELGRNYGFIEGYNRGLKAATKDILVLLNNDMMVKPGFLAPLLDGFTDSQVFAVSSQIHFWDSSRRREETGKTRTFWYKGMIGYSHEIPTSVDIQNGYIPVFWLGGGSSAIDRQKFWQLGGFDRLLSPMYMDDVDLSYMAWKRGWKVLFCPQSEVIHKHRASSSRLDRSYLQRVIYRNRLLFIWKNITDFRMLLEHLIFLPFAPLRHSWELGVKDTAAVFWMAIARLPAALLQRNRLRLQAKVRDEEVFRVANNPSQYKEKYIPPSKVDLESLNVLVACAYFPSLRSGGGVRMYQMIRALAKVCRVSLVAFIDEEADKPYIADMEQVCSRVVTIQRKAIPRPLHVPVYPPAIEIDFGSPLFRTAIEELLAGEDFQVIQTEFLQIAPSIPASNRVIRVLTHHEVQNAAIRTRYSLEKNLIKRLHLLIQGARWLNAEITLAKNFDAVVALTDEDAWSLQRFEPALPVEVIPTGVDLDYFHPVESVPEPNSLIYVGNFRHRPNIDSILFLLEKVMPLVWQRFPGVHLRVVGANPPPEICAYGKMPGVEITGWVDDLRPYVERSKVFVSPIITGVGLRNKILEAWAMGKPVITTRLGCAGLDARHGENVWLAETPQEFADAIGILLGDHQACEQIGRNARVTVERYHSWEQVAIHYVDLYRRKWLERMAANTQPSGR